MKHAVVLYAHAAVLHEGMSILLRTLSPITPHVTHALWGALGYAGELIDAPWPEVDSKALEQDAIALVLQVNGKLRGHLEVPKDAPKEAIEKLAVGHEATAKYLAGRSPKKVIVVPGKLVNVVG